MTGRTVLVLEDNPERVATFTAVLRDADVGLEPKIWPDAGSFIAEADDAGEGGTISSKNDGRPSG